LISIVLQDKILQSSSTNETIQVTNDGATILKAIGVDNPAAKILVGEYPIIALFVMLH
jgi:chaperonin GroEL (HSP60 family)